MPVIEIEYFRADTFVHRLHPFTKIIFEIVVFVTAAVINDPLYSLIIILAITPALVYSILTIMEGVMEHLLELLSLMEVTI